jgi:hypothetical protein
MKNAVFWDVAPCGSCKNLSFGVTYGFQHQGKKNIVFLGSVLRLLATANVVPSSPVLVTLMMEGTNTSEI